MNSLLGVICFEGRPPTESAVKAAAEGLTGPKLDVGCVTTESGTVLQVRWSDAIAGSVRPTTAGAGRYVLLWDGRIDNRDELSSALGGSAPSAVEWTDEELVLETYQRWGESSFSRFVGDFALVIWDTKERRVVCARDPMGIRPLYYRWEPGRFIFASDAAPIVKLSGRSPRYNDGLLALYLEGKLGPVEETYFEGVSQVPARHVLTATGHGTKAFAYWEPDAWSTFRYSDAGEYIEHFQAIFDKAVASKLRGRQPVGLSLSGGLDSTAIACTGAGLVHLNSDTSTRIQAFSSVFSKIKSADESEHIRAIEKKCKIDVRYIVADEFWGWKPVESHGNCWNQPYPIPFMARHEALLATARAQGCRSILTGEGGDELLHRGFPHLIDLLRTRRIRDLRHEYGHYTEASRKEFQKVLLLWLAPRWIRRLYDRLKPEEKKLPWLNSQALQRDAAPFRPVEPPMPKGGSLHGYTVYVGMVNLGRYPHLAYMTEMYRRHGIEARHPFFDQRVVEFLIRTPPEMKFQHGRSKYLLRTAMADRVPSSVLQRRHKTNFDDVQLLGLRREADRLSRMVRTGYAVERGWIDADTFDRSLQQAIAGNRLYASGLAKVISLEAWSQQPCAQR